MGKAGIPVHRPGALAESAAARLLTAALLALAACGATHVASDYDRTAPFSTFHSFTLVVRPHPGAHNPIVEQRTYDAIRAALTSKGFAYVADPGRADFAVDFTIGARDRLDVRSYPAAHGGPWHHADWWGSEVDVRQYQEGTFAIDVFDVRSRRPVWHGLGKKELSQSDLEHSETVIREAVAAVLARFPPKEG
jgi:Domain of unknown function (DUF4136)